MKICFFLIVLYSSFFTQHTLAVNYYINSRYGEDSNIGTSMEAPWKSFINLEIHTFLPGDSILFARGSSYTGGFVFKSSGTAEKPIVFTTYSADVKIVKSKPRNELATLFIKYGAGPAPAFTNPDWNILNGNIFKILSDYIVIDGFYFHNNTKPLGSYKNTKNVQKMGVVYFATGTHHNVIKNCEFFNTPVAVKVKGTYCVVTRNYMHDASEMMAYSWGPIAIMITSKYNEVSYNKIVNYGAYGGPYGSDGGVIELDGVDDDFNATNIYIHHNISINNHGFLEMAARNIDSITVAYNLSDDRNQFIGGGSMKNVLVVHNTVIRTREPNVDRYVFWTFYPEGTSFNVNNNIFVLAKDIQVFGPYKKPVGHQRTGIGNQLHYKNIYYSPGNADPIGILPGKGDLIADPKFIDAQNGNFRLKPKSPAKNKGTHMDLATDLDDEAPVAQRCSIGCYN